MGPLVISAHTRFKDKSKNLVKKRKKKAHDPKHTKNKREYLLVLVNFLGRKLIKESSDLELLLLLTNK